MTWFTDRRQEFIWATLQKFGQIRRADLCKEFDLSSQQASADIAHWMAANPDKYFYDVSAKCYVIKEVP